VGVGAGVAWAWGRVLHTNAPAAISAVAVVAR